MDTLPCVQTLRQFPKEELFGKVVMVRFESDILLMKKRGEHSPAAINALSTIKYLYESGAKIVVVGNWSVAMNSKVLTVESVAGICCRTIRAPHCTLKVKVYCMKHECFELCSTISNYENITNRN